MDTSGNRRGENRRAREAEPVSRMGMWQGHDEHRSWLVNEFSDERHR